ncbi:hypothetical protein KEM48_007123 [Puccinia striiformis f. sp. tritici PST-130]|nr:hypothetical protein KEM48_007123 [Puccinia striiformis f. sp. tritici PST-130]
MAPSQTPLSSPSVLSEESSLESDGPLVIQPDDPDYRSVSLPSMVADYQSSSSIQTIRTHRVSQILSPTVQPPTSDFPPQSLVKNLGRFMRYSSAAYGQQFLRIMGIGVDSFNYPNTKKHSANDHAFASHVGLTVDQILLSSFTEPNPVLGNEVLSPLVHYVSIDHDSKAIVLTCRGTLGLSDILVDLTCEYEPMPLMYQVCDLLPFRFPPGRPIHSYTYGTPAVASLDLSEYTKGLVTTVCNGIDIVPTLSLGVLHDLKSIAISLHEEESVAIDIVKRVVGLYRPTKWMNSNGSASNPTSIPQQQQAQELLDQQEVERSKQKVTMNDHEIRNGVGMNRATGSDYLDPALDGSVFGKAENTPELADWLCPPGEVWHVESYEVFVVRENESSSSTSTTSTSGSSKDSRHSASTSDTRPVPVRPPPRTFSSSSSWKSSSQQQQQQSTHSQQATSSRREGRRIILRACDDVQARFSEPIFGKTMFHDHIPSQYELVLELLEAAIGSTNSPLHPMSSSSTNTSPSSGTK